MGVPTASSHWNGVCYHFQKGDGTQIYGTPAHLMWVIKPVFVELKVFRVGYETRPYGAHSSYLRIYL